MVVALPLTRPCGAPSPPRGEGANDHPCPPLPRGRGVGGEGRACVVAVLVLAGCNRCWTEVEAPCLEPTEVTVTRVVDGDTFDIEPALELPDGDTVDRVRMLCVDSPELTGGECYGAEAREWLTERIEGQQVTLHFAEECTGSYDRALAYVKLGGALINAEIAREGYALPLEEWFSDYPCCDEVEQAVLEAQEAGAGGWGVCGGGYPWGR
jgi:endonuclease YncB( thermonuclease family)